MTNARRAIWLAIIGCLIGVVALISGVLLTQDRATIAAIVEPLRSQSMHDIAYANSANPRPVSDITCKLATTTTTPTTVDVTSIALSWLTSPRLPSHGLVLVHRKPDGSGVDHTSNDSCTNVYAGAQLVLTYRPIVARAP